MSSRGEKEKEKEKDKGSKPSRSGGIRTLADLNRPSSTNDSDSDTDAPNEYYTGGHKSGMLVQDPTKGGNNNNDVDSIFDRARQVGAVERPSENLRPSSSRSFTGTGRLLSGETVAPSAAPNQPEDIVHNITFWRNGFTVNDGPLRGLHDPENASFLESIKESECPKELEPVNRKSTVHVHLIRKEENFPEPEVQHVPFQGAGRTLGGHTAPVSDPSLEDPSLSSAPTPFVGLVVDPNLPSTSIQLRLADGTRMVAHFNHHHTIGDIRGFIDASRPGGNRTYQLQAMGFPPKPLNDPTQTIEQAGIANSVVIQKN